jgi:hypothetical protein
MSKELIKALLAIGGLLLLLACAGLALPIELAFYLLAGWIFYLARVLPQVSVNLGELATALICLALLAWGMHGHARLLPVVLAASPGQPVRRANRACLATTLEFGDPGRGDADVHGWHRWGGVGSPGYLDGHCSGTDGSIGCQRHLQQSERRVEEAK